MHLWEADATVQRNLGRPQTTFDHFAFTAQGSAVVEADLTAAGIPFRVTHLPDSTTKQIFLTDPAGNLVELQFADG